MRLDLTYHHSPCFSTGTFPHVLRPEVSNTPPRASHLHHISTPSYTNSDQRYIRTSFRSCTLSTSYPSNSSSSSGSLTTTDPPHPLAHDTRDTSVQIQPRFAHTTSLTADGLGDHLSTRLNVSSRSRNRSRSQGTNVGLAVDDTDDARVPGLATFKIESLAAVRSEESPSPLLRRAFLMTSRAVVGALPPVEALGLGG